MERMRKGGRSDLANAREPPNKSKLFGVFMWYGFNVLWFFSAGGQKPEFSPEKIKIDEKDLDFMAEMGCNFVRVPTDYRYFVHDFDYGNYDETYLKLLD